MDVIQEGTGTVRPGSQGISGSIESAILVTIFEKGRGYQCAGAEAADCGDITIKQKGMAFERFCATTCTPFTGKADRYDLSGRPFFGISTKGLLFEEQLSIRDCTGSNMDLIPDPETPGKVPLGEHKERPSLSTSPW